MTVVRAKSSRASVLTSTRPGTSMSCSIAAAIIKPLCAGLVHQQRSVVGGLVADRLERIAQ